MTFIVATNVIASRPPERRLTGTPHARANCQGCQNKYYHHLSSETCGFQNHSDEENIGQDDETREYPDKNSVASEIVTLAVLPSSVVLQNRAVHGVQGDG